MAYDNLTNITTSVSGSWNGTSFSYATLPLESGVPHKDQLEVERIFSLPTSPDVAGQITVYDLHRIFIVNKNDYTVNETTSVINGLTPSNPTTRTYTLTGGTLSGTVVTIPTIIVTDAVVVRRKTFSSGKYVTWSAGTRLTSEQLNFQMNQLIKLNQELIYKLESEYLRSSDVTGSSAPAFGINNNLDMNSNKIVNLANPAASTDAVNKQYADAQYVKVGDSAAQSITGNKTFSGTTTFTGAVAANGGFTCDSTAFSVADTTGNTSIGGTLTVTGQANLNGGLNMDSGAFTVADTSGNTVVGGTLQVNGASTLASLAVDTTTLVVDASNNRVGIGIASPTVDLHVVASSNPIIASDATSSSGVSQVRAISDGAAIDLRSYGTAAGGSLSGITRSDLTAVYAATPTNLLIATSTAAPISFATADIVRITIPSNSSGITFPSSPTLSANNNTLDAYEKGTHTVAAVHVQGSGTAGTFTLDNSSASNNKITYTRIGNRVLFEGLLVFSAAPTGSPTGALQITNLPFTAGANAGATFNCEFQNIAGTTIYLLGLWSASTSVITFRQVAALAASSSAFAPNQIVTNTIIRFSGHIGL
jgi:hypothetical protein